MLLKSFPNSVVNMIGLFVCCTKITAIQWSNWYIASKCLAVCSLQLHVYFSGKLELVILLMADTLNILCETLNNFVFMDNLERLLKQYICLE